MGILIVLEGIDGVGKTTQARLLHRFFVEHKYHCSLEKEPTDGQYGRQLRQRFQRGQRNWEEEHRLFVADRREHVREKINPALAKGCWVILDRYYLSTMAYQGAAGLNMEAIHIENEQFAPSPDIVFWLDLDVDSSLERVKQRIHRSHASLHPYERPEYLEQVRQRFLQLSQQYSDRIVPVAAEQDIECIHQSILDVLKQRGLLDRQQPIDRERQIN